MADNQIEFDIVARLDGIDKSLKDLQDKGKDAGDKFGKGFSTALKVGLAAAAAGIAAFGVALNKGIQEAIGQENAINELNSALTRTGQYSKEASADMQNFASSIQSITVYGDDLILQNAALIQSLGKLSTQGLKEATTAATDLAAALNIDLRTASLLVGKAATGEVGSFSRYGLAIRQGATDAETFANALRAINDQFGGAAASKVNTYGGRIEQLKNSFGDLLEEMGMAIIKSPAVVSGIKFISDVVNRLTASIVEWRNSGGFERLLATATDVAYFFTAILAPVFETVIQLIERMGVFLGAFAASIVQLLSGEFKQAVTTFKDGIVETFDPTTFSLAGTNAALATITGFKQTILNAPPITSELKNKVATEVETFSDISWSGFVEGFRLSIEQMNNLAKGLMGQLRQTVVGGVGTAFAAMGAALVKGENAFAAFGKAVLSMFGDLAIQLGQFYLTLGLANLLSFNYAAAAGNFAAAAGLFILGGALKALGGGGGTSGASAGAADTGGGVAAGGFTSSPGDSATGFQETAATDPGTQVAVNIQGNVLGDKRTLGREIADALNEAFESDGAVIARGALA